MVELTRGEFEGLVREAVDGLPEQFLDRLENVDIVVADKPTHDQLAFHGLHYGETLFGLYEGVPLVDRVNYQSVLPDKITIFQKPLEAYASDRAELIHEVRDTVVHEVAHFFGINDESLREMGL